MEEVSTMISYSLVLADDHILFREGIKSLLQGKAYFEIVGESGDGLELLRLLDKVTPQMVILDISMPSLRGIEAIHEIKAIHPSVKILILTMHKDKELLRQAITAGAEGYLLKEDAGAELFSAIEKIRQGRIYVSPNLSEDLTDDWAQIHRGVPKPPSETPLTNRERQVLKMIADGKSRKEIGELLFISVRTVERHRANIIEKLNVKRTADLIKYALGNGYA